MLYFIYATEQAINDSGLQTNLKDWAMQKNLNINDISIVVKDRAGTTLFFANPVEAVKEEAKKEDMKAVPEAAAKEAEMATPVIDVPKTAATKAEEPTTAAKAKDAEAPGVEVHIEEKEHKTEAVKAPKAVDKTGEAKAAETTVTAKVEPAKLAEPVKAQKRKSHHQIRHARPATAAHAAAHGQLHHK